MTGTPGAAGAAGAAGAEGRAGTTGAGGERGPKGERGQRGKSGNRNAAWAFLILMSFSFFGFVRVDNGQDAIEQFARQTVAAQRDACERTNVLRENQAILVSDDIRETERALKGSLNGLERFRPQLTRGVVRLRERRQKLRDSVREHPLKGRRYAVDCKDAYPAPPTK